MQSPFYGDDEEELFQSICNEQVIYPRWFPADALNFVDKVHRSLLYHVHNVKDCFVAIVTAEGTLDKVGLYRG